MGGLLGGGGGGGGESKGYAGPPSQIIGGGGLAPPWLHLFPRLCDPSVCFSDLYSLAYQKEAKTSGPVVEN